ncbi:TPA: winged helix-turn-helix transcriptional regulator [bacterium]|nr:winged helix-turn-helix transcriptional regulator [bacterium]
MTQQIILRELQKPPEINLYEDINWLGESFGFSSGRDTNKITAKILQKLLQEISKDGSTSTEQLSKNMNIEVQRVNYHLRTLIDSGFICREKRLILLRQGSVKSAVEEIRKDANRIFDNLSIIAEEIDKNLGLKNR